MDGWNGRMGHRRGGKERGKERGSGFFFLFLFYIHDYMI